MLSISNLFRSEEPTYASPKPSFWGRAVESFNETKGPHARAREKTVNQVLDVAISICSLAVAALVLHFVLAPSLASLGLLIGLLPVVQIGAVAVGHLATLSYRVYDAACQAY